MGTNFWGPSVHGDRIGGGLFVQSDQSIIEIRLAYLPNLVGEL